MGSGAPSLSRRIDCVRREAFCGCFILSVTPRKSKVVLQWVPLLIRPKIRRTSFISLPSVHSVATWFLRICPSMSIFVAKTWQDIIIQSQSNDWFPWRWHLLKTSTLVIKWSHWASDKMESLRLRKFHDEHAEDGWTMSFDGQPPFYIIAVIFQSSLACGYFWPSLWWKSLTTVETEEGKRETERERLIKWLSHWLLRDWDLLSADRGYLIPAAPRHLFFQ